MSMTPSGLFGSGGAKDRAGSGGSKGGGFVEVKLERMFEKPPPASVEAEMSLLGAMILEPGVIGDVIPIVPSGEAFYMEAHAVVFDALIEVFDRTQGGNLVLLGERLKDLEVLKDVGGMGYLEQLAQETPGPAAAVHFAKIVSDKARLRRLIEAGGQIVYDAYNLGQGDHADAGSIIDAAEAKIFAIAEKEETGQASRLAELLQEEYDKLERLAETGAVPGVKTWFRDLDEQTTGLQNGEMIIIAARPSMGKTALALNLAEQIACGGGPYESNDRRKKVPVGFFSLEMSKAAIAQRLLSARSGISSHDMRSGRLGEDGFAKLLEVCGELHDAPIFIDDTPGLTVLGLRTRARRMVSQLGVRAIMIDYLQLMTAPGAARESRQVEVSAISRGIKALARELNVPVVCLSQLNRGPESRGDNRPRMSDLRESGSIEQDADVVALLHREAYYHVGDVEWEQEHPDKQNEAELIIAKQRNGPTGTVKLRWDSKTTRFKDSGGFGGGYDMPPESAFGGGGAEFGGGVRREIVGGPAVGGARGGGAGGGGGGGGAFAPSRRSGPEEGDVYRDGGGPEREDMGEDEGGDVPPF